MIRRPPRSTLDRSSAASDVYKRQHRDVAAERKCCDPDQRPPLVGRQDHAEPWRRGDPVSYTHLRAHETVLDLVCRLLLENKNTSAVINVT